MMIQLSAVIITFNEGKKIERCLRSLQSVVDEIVVVDSLSTDNTKDICSKYNVTFIEQPFLGYIEQKNFAIKQATYDYIISLDGDEALSAELVKSVAVIKSNWIHDGYYMNRFNNFCGQWIKYSDWYPDRKLRLFKKGSGSWQGINPHDEYTLYNGRTYGHINGDILHWNYATYKEFNIKTDLFSTVSAEAYYKLGKKAPIWKVVFNPTWAFFKAYFLRLGFLDGFNGFVICVQTANITFLKYSKLRELIRKSEN
jgi:glycosyltransferase involved in cell wall biosynthesis